MFKEEHEEGIYTVDLPWEYPGGGQLCGQQIGVQVSRCSYFNVQSHAVIAALLIPLDRKLVFDCVIVFSALHQFYSPARRNCKEVKTHLQACWVRGRGIMSRIGDFYHRKLFFSSMLIDEIVKISTSGVCEFCIQGKRGYLYFILLSFSLSADLGKQHVCLASVCGLPSFLCK